MNSLTFYRNLAFMHSRRLSLEPGFGWALVVFEP